MKNHNWAEFHVVLEKAGPKIELRGTRTNILMAWGWLTLCVCDRFGISPDTLAARMPSTLDLLRKSIRGAKAVDIVVPQESEEGDAP